MATPTDQYQHPLPPPPQQRQQPLQQRQQPPQQRPKSQSKPRTFSFHSDKSRRSSAIKVDYTESHADKESRRIHTKADPTMAMSEAEPSAVAAMMTQSTTAPLRSLQHRDAFGNPIADPDRSNPTRNRWERPLDTIRSFEAAIDGGYSHAESAGPGTRRSSMMMMSTSQPRFPQDGYYGSRPVSFRAEGSQYSAAGPGAGRQSSYYDAQHAGSGHGGNGYGPAPTRTPRDRTSRMHSEPYYQTYGREQNVYPLPHKDRSYETVTSAAASGNSDPAGYQTDPTSSDNSSIHRVSPANKPEPVNDYGIGFSQPQAYQAPSFSVGGAGVPRRHPLPPPPTQAGQQTGRPSVPRKETAVLRRQPTQPRPEAVPEKRKSWLARRFSKNQ